MYPSKSIALVRGVNVVSKHTKPTQEKEGGIIKKESPIHIQFQQDLKELKDLYFAV